MTPFAGLKEGTSPDPKIEYMLARLIILPPLLRLTIDFATNCDRRKEAFKWVSMVLSQTSAVLFNTPPVFGTIPAMFAHMSVTPQGRSKFAIRGGHAAA